MMQDQSQMTTQRGFISDDHREAEDAPHRGGIGGDRGWRAGQSA
jgi:hypothetical protein